MEHEIRFYLKRILEAMQTYETEENTENGTNEAKPSFVPQYIVTAVKLPTGAIEIATNNSHIKEKIEYILESYDDEMRLKTNEEVVMCNIMVV
jgi:hypothetical protein